MLAPGTELAAVAANHEEAAGRSGIARATTQPHGPGADQIQSCAIVSAAALAVRREEHD